MARPAKHNWKKLYLEYCQGRYKNVTEFAKAKKLPVRPTQREFKKLQDAEKSDHKRPEQTIRTGQNRPAKKQSAPKSDHKLHPWEKLKQQFTDWPEDKLQAYLTQIESRLAYLRAIPDEELTPGEMKEIGKLRRDRRAILSDPDPEHVCSAHKHDGSKCRNPVERGRRVCWVHGGAPGSGTRHGQQHALKHGLYSRFIPDDDPDAQAFMADVETKTPLDILWEGIKQLSYVIARSTKIAWVKNKDDITKHLKRVRKGNYSQEVEYELQFSWDKYNRYLQALAAAEKTLDNKIMRYEELLEKYEKKELATKEHRLRLEKLRQDMEINRERLQLEKSKVLGDTNETEDDGFIDALHAKAGEAWDEYSDSDDRNTSDSESDEKDQN